MRFTRTALARGAMRVVMRAGFWVVSTTFVVAALFGAYLVGRGSVEATDDSGQLAATDAAPVVAGKTPNAGPLAAPAPKVFKPDRKSVV